MLFYNLKNIVHHKYYNTNLIFIDVYVFDVSDNLINLNLIKIIVI